MKICNNSEEENKTLLEEYLINLKSINDDQKKFLHKIFLDVKKYHDLLFRLYIIMQNKNKLMSENELNFKYTYQDNNCIIIFNEETQQFKYEILKHIISCLIDITEEVLPLGTLVELKKHYLKEVCDVNSIEKIRVVITHRFIDLKGKSYHTYGGIIYPLGNFNSAEIITFSPSLIENVVHKGFSDKQENAYVYLMKKELIIDKNLVSSGFFKGDDNNE